MDRKALLLAYWQDLIEQNEGALAAYFLPEARIRWHDSNEEFELSEYISANCEYPGDWKGAVERIELMGDLAVTATQLSSADGSASFHVVSFFKFQKEKIALLDEYWGETSPAAQWRLDKNLGRPIKREK